MPAEVARVVVGHGLVDSVRRQASRRDKVVEELRVVDDLEGTTERRIFARSC